MIMTVAALYPLEDISTCPSEVTTQWRYTNVLVFISPHGITMSWAYIFLFSFLTPLRSLNGSQPNLDTYSAYDCYVKIWSELSRAFTSHHTWAGGKNAFLEPTLNFDRTYLYNGSRYQQSEWNLSTGTPLHALQIWRIIRIFSADLRRTKFGG